MSQPLVSVVVPARDARAGVAQLLEALARQTLARDRWEVVVVDDGSRVGIADLVEAAGGRHLRLPLSRGAYVARNRALEVACGEAIAFTDADCTPRTDWLERGLAALRDAQLVGGRIAMRLGPRPTLAEVVDVARGLNQRRMVEEWGYGATANLFVQRRVIADVGPFNEALRSGGDDELCKRATARGHVLRYADDVVVDHETRRSARALVSKAFRDGRGLGHLRHVGRGPARAQPRLWATPRRWAPRRGLLGAEVLADQGYRPSPARRVALDMAQWLMVLLPHQLGDLTADLEYALRLR
jgi:glycosyltransferase involved in cell wall biosynthesis